MLTGKSPTPKEVEVLVKDLLLSDQELPDNSGHGLWHLLVIEEIITWFPGAREEIFLGFTRCVLSKHSLLSN